MVLSYSQAGETGLGTDKEREEKEEKEDIFHYLIISKLARTNGKMTLKRARAAVPRKGNGGDPDGNPSSPGTSPHDVSMID
ncbi:hypothetical protein YC2023_118532 [Brassica napus]